MKTAQRLGTAALIGILALVFVYAQLSEFSYTLNYSQLPFATQETIIVTAQPNTTILMAYGNWLSGENQIYLNNTNQTNLTVNVLVPANTTIDNYTQQVFILATNGTPNPNRVDFYFYLLNDSIPVNITVDLDGDGYHNDTDCNDTNPDINPGKQEIPYNSLDDDCNPNTPDQVNFSIEINKAVYNIGEEPLITIRAVNYSNITLNYSKLCTTCGNPPPYQFITSQTFTNGAYPMQKISPYHNVSGLYLIEAVMRYRNTTRTDSLTYAIENSLSISIDGDTTIKQGAWTVLEATASGGISTYTYKWKLSDGTTKTNQTVNITLKTPGTYTQKINVTDAAGNKKNKTIEITVKKTYKIIFYVKDASTKAIIKGATVDVEGEDAVLTDSIGKATFYLTAGDKEVAVWAENYEIYNTDYDIQSNKTYTINLTKEADDLNPVITLTSPTNNQKLTGTSATFKFKVTDDKTNNCSLYLAEADNDWFALKQSKKVTGSAEQTFTLTDLEDGSYKWKIECVATDGKSAFSEERTFSFSQSQLQSATEGQVEVVAASDLLSLLNSALDKANSFDTNQNIAANALNFEKNLQDALDLIDRTGRDISDLDFRRDLSEQEKTKKREEMIAAMEDLRYKLPVDIDVKDTKKFVKYIREEELQPITKEYLDLKSSSLNEKKFTASVMELQKKFTVSTTAQTVTLSFIDSPDQTITLVIKDFEYSDDIKMPNVTSNLYDVNIKKNNYFKILESIPKDLAQNVAMLNISNAYEVLKADPLIQIGADKTLIYYIKSEVSLEDIKQTNSILIDTSGGKALGAVTGASIFEFSFEEVKNAALIIIIIIIVMIGYFAITFKWADKAKLMWFVATSDKQLHYLRVLINDVLDYLRAGNYEKAAFLYREIKLAYEKLSIPAQNTVYDEVVPVFSQLDIAYLKDLIDKINVYIRTNQLDKAQTEYSKLRGTYHRLSPDYKREVYPKIEPIINILGAENK